MACGVRLEGTSARKCSTNAAYSLYGTFPTRGFLPPVRLRSIALITPCSSPTSRSSSFLSSLNTRTVLSSSLTCFYCAKICASHSPARRWAETLAIRSSAIIVFARPKRPALSSNSSVSISFRFPSSSHRFLSSSVARSINLESSVAIAARSTRVPD